MAAIPSTVPGAGGDGGWCRSCKLAALRSGGGPRAGGSVIRRGQVEANGLHSGVDVKIEKAMINGKSGTANNPLDQMANTLRTSLVPEGLLSDGGETTTTISTTTTWMTTIWTMG